MAPSALFESPFTDAEIRAFIDAAPRGLPYSELAVRLRERFGRDRAWSIDRIRAYCLLAGAALKGHRFKFSNDWEVLIFVDDRIGRLTFAELAAECRHQFGQARAPSRSSLHRYGQFLAAILRDRPASPTSDPD